MRFSLRFLLAAGMLLTLSIAGPLAAQNGAVQQPLVAAPQRAATAAQQSAAKSDPVAQVIAEAEKAWQAGQEDYNAGHLDAAKQDFDHAVDILMQSPVDIKSDDRLEQEFDKVPKRFTSWK